MTSANSENPGKSSAQRLFQLVYGEHVEKWNLYQLGSTADRLCREIFEKIGADIYDDIDIPWPIETNIAEALRLCMRDYSKTYVSEQFSRLLLRCGFSDPEIMAALGTWDVMMFNWRAQGMTVSRLKSLLEEAGLPNDIPEKSCNLLAAWIENPLSAVFYEHNVFVDHFLCTVFNDRCLFAGLDSESSDPAELFAELFTGLDFKNQIENVSYCYNWHWLEERVRLHGELQESDSEEWLPSYSEGKSLVHFLCGGHRYVFFLGHVESRLNDAAVLSNFDALMELLGRNERAYRIKAFNWEDGGYFIVGDPIRLERLFTSLGFEGMRASPEANSSYDFGTGYGPFKYGEEATLHRVPA